MAGAAGLPCLGALACELFVPLTVLLGGFFSDWFGTVIPREFRAGDRDGRLGPVIFHHFTNIGIRTITYSSDSVNFNTPGLVEVVVSSATLLGLSAASASCR